VAGDRGNATGRGKVRGEIAYDRGLAGAIVAEQAHNLVLFDVEAHAVDGHHGAEVL
jgi:hypothetical protein